MEALLAKFGSALIDALKWAWVAIVALIVHIFRSQAKSQKELHEALEKKHEVLSD